MPDSKASGEPTQPSYRL